MRADRFYQLLRLNRAVPSHRIKFAGLLGLYGLRRRHLWLRFDPVMSCNLRCQMCYFSEPNYVKEHTGRFEPAEVERLAEVFFPWAMQLYLGCGTEPTTYKGFLEILVLAKKHKVPMLGMVTNGQLLTEEHLEKFVDLGLDELTLSTHGVLGETYERMMRRASFARFVAVLDQLETIKKRRSSDRPHLRLNYTVNQQNLEELSRFFDVYGKYSLRTLQVRPIIDLGDTEYTDKDMRPYVARYNQILGGLEGKCREKGIRLLANYEDVSYEKKTTRGALIPEILVYISPESVSLPDFRWRQESYLDYRRRTRWAGHLLRGVLGPASKFEAASPYLSYKVVDQ